MFSSADYDADKTVEVLLQLAINAAKFDQYKACKLVFLADKRHLVRYGRTITGDTYSALTFGPIPSTTRNRISNLLISEESDLKEVFSLDRKFKYPRLIAKRKANLEFLSKTETDVLKEICNEFGAKSFDELKVLTHEMPAYKKAWKEHEKDKAFDMSFEDFFEEDEDAVEGALEEMKENLQLRDALG